jgi:hypothetical protein
MSEEQYYSYMCTANTMAEAAVSYQSGAAKPSVRGMLAVNQSFTEPWCWENAMLYLEGELMPMQYYELGCDLRRLPNEDVLFQNRRIRRHY